MKNAVKSSILLLASLYGFQTSAQDIGIRGGVNFASVLDKDEDGTYSDSYNNHPGFHAGLMMNLPFMDVLSLETGLFVTTKGFRFEDNIFGVETMAKANLLYLDIPITLKASTSLGGGGAKIYGALGPYLGYGLSGKVKTTVKYQGVEETEEMDVKWGNDADKDDLKRTDFGFTFGAGIEAGPAQMGVAYALGMSNNSSYTDFGTVFKNRVLQFFVGYWFPVSD